MGGAMRINKQSPPLFLSLYLINLFLFLAGSYLSLPPSPPPPLRPPAPGNIFLHFRDKNHSLLIHSSPFVSVSHNKSDNAHVVTSPPTSIKTSLKSSQATEQQKDDGDAPSRSRVGRGSVRHSRQRAVTERKGEAGRGSTRSACSIGVKPLISIAGSIGL